MQDHLDAFRKFIEDPTNPRTIYCVRCSTPIEADDQFEWIQDQGAWGAEHERCKPAVYRWTFKIFPKMGMGEMNHPCDQIFMAIMHHRHSAYYTEADFEIARREAVKLGFVLQDIEKWPVVNPEFVPMILEECLCEPPHELELAEINGTYEEWEHFQQMHHDMDHDEMM